MDTLPNEILVKVFQQLGVCDMFVLRAVSKQWKNLIDVVRKKQIDVFRGALESCNVKWWNLPTSEDAPCARIFHACARYGRFIYLFGGKAEDEIGSPCNDLYSFDLLNLTWRQIETSGDVPIPREACTLVGYKGKLLLHGGFGEGRFLYDTHVFNISTERWRKVECEMGCGPFSCVLSSASVVGEKVVLFGGEGTYQFFNDLWLFDTEAECWEMCSIDTEKPSPRANHSLFTTKENKIILFGGLKNNVRNFMSDVWLLDINEKKWTQLRVLNVPQAPLKPNRFSPTMIDGKIIVFGPDEFGPFGDEKLQHMYILDCSAAHVSSSCQWVTSSILKPPLSLSGCFTACAGDCEIVLIEKSERMEEDIGQLQTIVVSAKCVL